MIHSLQPDSNKVTSGHYPTSLNLYNLINLNILYGMSEHIQTGIAGSDTGANQVLVSICEHQGMYNQPNGLL